MYRTPDLWFRGSTTSPPHSPVNGVGDERKIGKGRQLCTRRRVQGEKIRIRGEVEML